VPSPNAFVQIRNERLYMIKVKHIEALLERETSAKDVCCGLCGESSRLLWMDKSWFGQRKSYTSACDCPMSHHQLLCNSTTEFQTVEDTMKPRDVDRTSEIEKCLVRHFADMESTKSHESVAVE
jgi:hypothetical protein